MKNRTKSAMTKRQMCIGIRISLSMMKVFDNIRGCKKSVAVDIEQGKRKKERKKEAKKKTTKKQKQQRTGETSRAAYSRTMVLAT
jgi:hypothetical protein